MIDDHRPIYILMIEDSEDDALLVSEQLRLEGWNIHPRRVESVEALDDALRSGRWDVVLSDQEMPEFDAFRALEQVRRFDPAMPFVIVSGKIGETTAVEAMQAGVSDYVMKGDIERLAVSIEKAIAQASAERSRQEAEQALKRREAYLRAITSHIPGMVFRMGLAEGNPSFLYVSDGAQYLLHCSPSDLRTDPALFFSRVHADDIGSLREALQACYEGERYLNWTGRLDCDWDSKWVNLRGTVDWEDGKPFLDGVMLNVTQSKRNELRLEHSRRELEALTDRLHEVREEERANIAAEVHDELGSMLTAAKMELFTTSRWAGRTCADSQAVDELTRRIDTVGERVDSAVETVRRIARDLRPKMLDDLGVRTALEWYAEEFARSTDLDLELDLDDDLPPMGNELETAIFRIAQETLTNVARHARATSARLSLTGGEHGLELRVRDNGQGIRPERIFRPDSTGLAGIRQRARQVGGAARVSGEPGRGTEVAVHFPVRDVDQQDATSHGGHTAS